MVEDVAGCSTTGRSLGVPTTGVLLSPCKDAGFRPDSPSFLSLEDKFPDKLRLSIVRPMLKEGNERYCNKYRPIRLVSSNVHEYYIEKAL